MLRIAIDDYNNIFGYPPERIIDLQSFGRNEAVELGYGYQLLEVVKQSDFGILLSDSKLSLLHNDSVLFYTHIVYKDIFFKDGHILGEPYLRDSINKIRMSIVDSVLYTQENFDIMYLSDSVQYIKIHYNNEIKGFVEGSESNELVKLILQRVNRSNLFSQIDSMKLLMPVSDTITNRPIPPPR